ncbi:hypothetical protein O181_092266 [Austropuccinia psidii MF-1]|uniref:Uncharacterized protein n=1 Tax=Austropuccinia psidii MF-1 TaxID=1389203 RepID=A0A9Q3IZ07_9BASI|nr:hypothetical protein [Austropuccinia psidii MF-1]
MPSPPLPSSSKSKPVVKTRKSPAPTPNLTSTIKRNPIQMLMQDAPPDFKYTKEALYVHIKLLWGMLTPEAIPTAPDKQLLKEFYQQFSSAEELGICIWAPNLEEAPDSIYNDAWRIVAAYDHYVHYVLSKKFRKETRERGWNVRDVERKVGQRERQRLHDRSYKFLVTHKYPKRYQIIASDINTHRNNEYNAKAGIYIINTLSYQSDSATSFFRRLCIRMNDVDSMMGWRSNQQVCRRPKKPIISDFEKTPKNIPIDFYRPEWFNEKNHSEKQIVADLSEVSLVPIRDLPPGPKQHPNEQLGNRAFNQKYWHFTIKEYKVEPHSPYSSDRYSAASSIGDESVDLDAEHDVDNNLLEKEIIKNEKSKVELEREENKRRADISEDVVMTDAWDSRFTSRNWRMEGFEDDTWQ